MKPCTWNSFISNVIGDLSGPDKRYRRPPDTFIIHTAKLAAMEMVNDSGMLRDKSCVPAQCGVREYPIYADAGRDIISVQRVEVDGKRHRGWEYQTDDGMVYMRTLPAMEAKEVCFTYSYTVDIAGCADMPAFLCGQLARQALKTYTLRNLFGMPEQDWYNPALHNMYRADAVVFAARLTKHAAGSTSRVGDAGKRLEEKFWTM